MNMNDNVVLVRTYFDALASGEFERLGQLFADDVIWHQPGQGSLSGKYVGKEALFALFGSFMERSGGSFRIDDVGSIMANGNLVAATLHFFAESPAGAMAMSGVDLMRVEGGQIREVWVFSGDQVAEDAFWG